MTYQKDQTGILQSATKAAAELTAAEVAAGIVKSHDTIVKRFIELRDEVILPDLKAAVDADNAMFKAEEAAAPAKPARKGGTARGGAKPSGANRSADISDPGSVTINGNGKFAGLTVAEVFALTGEQAAEYGYTDKEGVGKPGSLYIKWMEGNESNPFMQRVAKAFVEGLRATSEAA